MNDEVEQESVNRIVAIIAETSNGATIGQITEQLEEQVTTRTVQRRLQQLVEAGVIETVGQARATRYILSGQQPTVDLAADGIPLSSSAKEVQALVAQPLSERKPVGYNRDFLFDYVPNQSFYLSPSMRAHLHEIGKQPDGEQPAGTFARKILDRLLIDLSWNSSRLEGNTYSLLETERLIHQNKAAEGKGLFETRMILNHKAAIEFMIEMGDDLDFNSYTILNIHALLAKNLLGDPSAPGRLRSIPVGIGKTTYTPVVIPQLIDDYFKKILSLATAIEDPFEQSFFAMVHLPYLQPFVDVNKRVSRLSCNIPLIKYNYCPISFVDLPKQAYISGIVGVYEFNRVELLADVYLWIYEQSTSRYSEARAFFSEPDVFKERYDTQLTDLIRRVVHEKQDKPGAITLIKEVAQSIIPVADQSRFIEVVQSELLALHAGSIAAYKIKLDEFEQWQKVWEK